MAHIEVLDQATINQIAAGEVVERPSSVVKELVENAIDAGATAITIEIKNGGIDLIRITDNGCGIPKEEVRVAFLRHSTSKIRKAADLFDISTLGFRGEALSSIAAVAQVELITKTADSLTGVSYVIHGGEEQSMDEIGAPEGTTFLIQNLFYNTPARRKFLKSPSTEAGYVIDVAEHMALSHPKVSLRLIVNGQNRLHTTGSGRIRDLIYMIYGKDVSSNVLNINSQGQFLRVQGVIGKPVIARGNRTFETYFINGRYIKSVLLAKAIEDAYKPFMMQHRYPFVVLYIEIDSDYVDVNVHPNKMELRFKQEQDICDELYRMLGAALAQKEFIPQTQLTEEKEKVGDDAVEFSRAEPFEKRQLEEDLQKWNQVSESKSSYQPEPVVSLSQLQKAEQAQMPIEGKKMVLAGNYRDGQSVISSEEIKKQEKAILSEEAGKSENKQQINKDSFNTKELKEKLLDENKKNKEEVLETKILEQKQEEVRSSKLEHTTELDGVNGEQMSMFDNKLLSKQARVKHKLIGQIFDTYWLIQYEDKLFIMDQHAAHEKVLYEKFVQDYKEKRILSQMITPPWVLTLSSREEEVLKNHRQAFAELGFEIEYFGGKDYAVRAIPSNLFGLSEKELLIDLLDNLGEENSVRMASQIVTDKIASMACKAAVKGNNALSFQEADALIDQLLTLENPYACPHGRPTIISMSKYEIEKKFKRIV
ncbi:MAG: DNA mismatch repair endonuclease MutL [Lachnospiraceae bacterium]